MIGSVSKRLIFHTIFEKFQHFINAWLLYFSVWKNKVASMNLTVRNRNIFGTYTCRDLARDASRHFLPSLFILPVADKSPVLIRKAGIPSTSMSTSFSTSSPRTTHSTTPPSPFSAFERSQFGDRTVYGDPRAFSTIR